MSHRISCTSVLWHTAALAALVATPLSAGESVSRESNHDPIAHALVEYSLSDGTDDLDLSGEFLSSGVSDLLDEEKVEPCPAGGSGVKCNSEKAKALQKKVAGAYGDMFYLNNFDYLCDPCYHDSHLGEVLKRRAIGDWITLDVGGQFRMRQHAERNMRGLGLTGLDDDFLLYRTRLYTNVEVGNSFRFFAEGLDANSDYENFAPRPIEVNRMDMLNLFGDLRLLDTDSGELWARAGRQELQYGRQRLISPLDWADTRRTFEGYKLFWSGEAWDADLFYTRPIYPNATHFDRPDDDREFMGTFLTYKQLKNNKLDLYYLAYNNNSPPGGDFNYDTFGANLTGNWEVWLWDLEAAYQSGNYAGHHHDAGMYTVGLGRNFECVKWKPTVWAYYDWASGDDIIGNGFDHLFPLAHKWLGLMDFYGRRNLVDANVLLTFSPHERLKLLCWYHVFHLQNIHDVPYSVVMTPFNPANPPGSTDLGQELDTIVTITLTPRTELLFGYSHFFAGDYYFTTPGVPYAGDASFFYTQLHINF